MTPLLFRQRNEALHGDCVEVMKSMEGDSIDFGSASLLLNDD